MRKFVRIYCLTFANVPPGPEGIARGWPVWYNKQSRRGAPARNAGEAGGRPRETEREI